MAKVGRQGPLQPQTTASIDDINHYERHCRLAFDLHDYNHAISPIYRSDEIKYCNKFTALILVLQKWTLLTAFQYANPLPI